MSDTVPAQPSAIASRTLSLIDVAIVLAKRKKIVFGMPLVGSLIALVVVLLLPSIYTGTARILPPQPSQSAAAIAALGALNNLPGASASLGQSLGLKNPAELYVGMLKGHTIADRLIERFKLKDLYGLETMFMTRIALENTTKISAGRDGLIRIEVEDKDPDRAAHMANAYVEELERLMQGLALTEAAQRRLFFERELVATREKLAQAELALKSTQERTGLIRPEGQTEAIFTAIAELRARVAAKEVEIAAMRTFATESNPALARAQQELQGLNSQLSRLEKSNGGKKAEGNIFVPTGTVPQAGLEYLRNARELKYQELLFELLAKQFEMAKIDEANDAAVVQVVDKAIPPDFKSRPKRALILISVAFFLFAAGVAVALALESLESLRQSSEYTERLSRFLRYLALR
jgi:tyrosine-protein kinase Etk/Wzc